jgi:hypothetical protein
MRMAMVCSRIAACAQYIAADWQAVFRCAGIRSGRDDGPLHQRVLDGFRKRGTGFLFAAAATIGTAGTCLQFGKGIHAIGRFAADVMVGNSIAKADVHDAYKNANANDCQQLAIRRLRRVGHCLSTQLRDRRAARWMVRKYSVAAAYPAQGCTSLPPVAQSGAAPARTPVF